MPSQARGYLSLGITSRLREGLPQKYFCGLIDLWLDQNRLRGEACVKRVTMESPSAVCADYRPLEVCPVYGFLNCDSLILVRARPREAAGCKGGGLGVWPTSQSCVEQTSIRLSPLRFYCSSQVALKQPRGAGLAVLLLLGLRAKYSLPALRTWQQGWFHSLMVVLLRCPCSSQQHRPMSRRRARPMSHSAPSRLCPPTLLSISIVAASSACSSGCCSMIALLKDYSTLGGACPDLPSLESRFTH